MITQLFLRSPSKECLSFHIRYFNTGVINREDYKKRILSSCSSFPAAEQNLVRHAKLPLVHSFFNFSSQYCYIKCEGTVTTEKVNSISKRMTKDMNITRVNLHGEEAVRVLWLSYTPTLNSRKSNSFTNETHALPIIAVPSS